MGAKRARGQSHLTPKQRVFALEYLACLNASEAYRRAGYASKNADVDGPALLGNPGVRAFIKERQARREAKLELTAERVLQELARIAFFDPAGMYDAEGRLLNIPDMPEDVRRAIAGVDVEKLFAFEDGEKEQIGHVVKVKVAPKVDAIEKAMKHLGLLVDRHQVDVTVKSHADLLAEAYRRLEEKRRTVPMVGVTN
jgi:phage terminase small subunit